MTRASVSDEEFIRLFEAGGAAGVKRETGVEIRSIYTRRRNLERKYGRAIGSPDPKSDQRITVDHDERLMLRVDDGHVLIGSDCHYWPERISTAHCALLHFAKKLKPAAIILNGDVMDLPKVSRFSANSWIESGKMPDVADELEGAKERLTEIEKVAPGARKIWTLGNHDSRFEARLASRAPEYIRVQGSSLKDHFPLWEPCWSVWINGEVVVKHRFKGGDYAPRNNTLYAGKTMVTGHLHSQKVIPHTDYNGDRWGMDTGTMAETFGPQFSYMEDNPRNWRQGFGILRFVKGELLQPQLVRVVRPGVVDYANALHEV